MSGFLGGLASLKFSEELKLTGTSLVGIFLFMHGWALILGGYPDEFELGERLDNGEKVKLVFKQEPKLTAHSMCAYQHVKTFRDINGVGV